MKNIVIACAVSLLLCACGVGSYSISSGKADECAISFTTLKSTPISVVVDGKTYEMSSVKDKAWKTDRQIRQTAENTIKLTPGAHEVKVSIEGKEVYSKKLYISASEHKVVEL